MHRVKSRSQIALASSTACGSCENRLRLSELPATRVLFRFLLIDHDQGRWRRNGGLCFIANLIIWNRFGFSASPRARPKALLLESRSALAICAANNLFQPSGAESKSKQDFSNWCTKSPNQRRSGEELSRKLSCQKMLCRLCDTRCVQLQGLRSNLEKSNWHSRT